MIFRLFEFGKIKRRFDRIKRRFSDAETAFYTSQNGVLFLGLQQSKSQEAENR